MARVLILIPVLLIGGTERYTLVLARVLCDAGHPVEVICYFEHDLTIVTAVKATGANVTLLTLRRKAGLLRLLNAIRPSVRQARPETWFMWNMAPGFVPVHAAKMAGALHVFATVHRPATP